MAPDSTHAVAPGDLIDGRYHVVSLLAEGGMGAVFLAEHMGLSKEVALKVIHPSIAGDGEIRARFAREAMASARIEHPHVASTLDIGTLPDGSAYLVMPLIRGPSLAEALLEGPMPWPRAVSIAAQIADALEAAHAAGIVHRDLKPDNVVLMPREDGRDHVKVLDFGIAGLSELVPSMDRPLTRAGMVMGTPGYMSPEQAVGEVVDARTDLYALGVILWEAIIGRSLFTGPDITTIVTLQLTTVATPIASIDPNVPVELDALVSRLLACARDRRPADAGEVRDVLVASLPALRPSLVDSLPTTRESSQSVQLQSGSVGLADTIYPSSYPGPVAPAVARLVAIRDAFMRWSPSVRVAVFSLPILVVVVLFAFPERTRTHAVPVARPTATVIAEPTSDIVQTPQGPVIVERPAVASPPAVEGAEVEPVPVPVPRVIDASIESAIVALMNTESRTERQAAASTIVLAMTTPVPEYARALARLELAHGCMERKAALRSIAAIGDPLALPFVTRLDDIPRRGCGFRSRSDCNACIRSEIANTMRVLAALVATP
jgi:eukaryotic-like serine/threonine-protein kinase